MKNSLFSIFDLSPYRKSGSGGLIIALSEKKDGSMKFSDNSEDKKNIENRKKFFKKFGIEINQVVNAELMHGNKVCIVAQKNKGERIPKTDGLLTGEKNLFLSITVADCLPIFLYDYKNQVIGLIHGGWRSLSQNILSLAIRKLVKNFNSLPQNILAGIGPGICQQHFEVKEKVLEKFKKLAINNLIKKEKKKIFFDLKKLTQIQLLNLGLKEENIEINPDCTFCLANKYFSYRRETPQYLVGKTKVLNAMIAVIGKPSKTTLTGFSFRKSNSCKAP